MGATTPSSNNRNPQNRARGGPTLLTGGAGHQVGAGTHVAVVDVEDVDSGRRLDSLHSGPVPGGERQGLRWRDKHREMEGGREQTEEKEMSQ